MHDQKLKLRLINNRNIFIIYKFSKGVTMNFRPRSKTDLLLSLRRLLKGMPFKKF